MSAAMDAADLAFAGAARQAQLIADGEVSSRELVQTYLDRIERLDPQLNAFRVVLAERALAEADQADARRKAGGERLLLGVPVAIKDDVDVAGEADVLGHRGRRRRRRATTPRSSRGCAAPARSCIGKTHVPELMLWPFTETLTFGVTRNPWDLDRTPGGSSGGSAAAVAAGLCGRRAGLRRRRLDPHPRRAWCGLVRHQAPARPRADGPARRRVAGHVASTARWRAASPTPRCSSTRPPTTSRPAASSLRRARRPARCGSPARPSSCPGRSRGSPPTCAPPSTRTIEVLRVARPRGRASATPTTRRRRSSTCSCATCAGIHDDVADAARPASASSAARGRWRGSGG